MLWDAAVKIFAQKLPNRYGERSPQKMGEATPEKSQRQKFQERRQMVSFGVFESCWGNYDHPKIVQIPMVKPSIRRTLSKDRPQKSVLNIMKQAQ
jgi:hypothetical protein